jgi:hypothetical protein
MSALTADLPIARLCISVPQDPFFRMYLIDDNSEMLGRPHHEVWLKRKGLQAFTFVTLPVKRTRKAIRSRSEAPVLEPAESQEFSPVQSVDA